MELLCCPFGCFDKNSTISGHCLSGNDKVVVSLSYDGLPFGKYGRAYFSPVRYADKHSLTIARKFFPQADFNKSKSWSSRQYKYNDILTIFYPGRLFADKSDKAAAIPFPGICQILFLFCLRCSHSPNTVHIISSHV